MSMTRTQRVQAVVWLNAIAAAARRHAEQIKGELHQEAFDEYQREGTAPTWRIPEVGRVSSVVAKTRVVITGDSAWLAWVQRRYPDQIATVQTVRAAWAAKFLDRVTIEGDTAIDPATGEVIRGLTVVQGGGMTGVSITPEPDARDLYARYADRGLRLLAADGGPAALAAADEIEAAA